VDLHSITPLILTYNERPNIERTLRGLNWARQIVVVDSGSTDGTLEILASHPAVHVKQRAFDDFAAQCNFGVSQIDTPWVLSIDADYVCPPELESELRALRDDANGFECSFIYSVFGRPLRSCLYPPRVVLFRTDHGRYVADGHAHRLQLNGNIIRLKTPVLHDDRKPFARWITDQCKYADLEVTKLLTTSSVKLGWKDRLRKRVVWAAPATLIYCLFVRRLILDGWPGVFYTLQRVYAELLLSLKLLEAKLRPTSDKERYKPSEERAGSHPASSHSERILKAASLATAGNRNEDPRN
jgi:glycosyltransferase involved in cell wall biosynthesis